MRLQLNMSVVKALAFHHRRHWSVADPMGMTTGLDEFSAFGAPQESRSMYSLCQLICTPAPERILQTDGYKKRTSYICTHLAPTPVSLPP